MKKRLIYIFAIIAIVFSLGAPSIVRAEGCEKTPSPSTSTSSTSGTQTFKPGASTPTGFDLNVKLKNPLKVCTIPDVITLFVNLVLKIALPFVIVFFIWSGLKFVLAQGNKTKLDEAKKMFYGTVIGTLLILGAWTITNAIIGTVNSLAGSSTTTK